MQGMTVSERVYQAVVALITGTAPPAGVQKVYDRMRMAGFADGEQPSIRVLPGLDQLVGGQSDYENVRELNISVELYAAGDEQIALLPAVHAEVHRRVWSDPTLGGLAVRPFNLEHEERRAEAERLNVQTTIRYRWRYRVAADDATVIP